jgi:hypothetical protein
MRFHKGQKVICIKDKSWTGCTLMRGEIYTVKDNYKCSCGSNQLVLKEEDFEINMICGCGNTEIRNQSYYEWRFRPYVVS